MSTAGKKERSLSRVYFDIGGTIFWTRPETLEKSTKLFSAYKDRVRHPHSDGSIDGESEKRPIRLDKDPEGFRHVLGYLRHPLYPFPPEFEYELQYYDIDYDGLFEDVDESGSDQSDDSDDSDVEDYSDSVNTDSDVDLDDLEDLEALEAELDAVSDDEDDIEDAVEDIDDKSETASKVSAATATSTKSRKLTSREKGEMERGRSRERRPPPSSSSKSSVVSKK